MAPIYRRYCSLYGCLNTSTSNPGTTFFKLPTDSARISEWLRLMCREDLANKSTTTVYRVCEIHFKTQDILPTPTRKILKKNALPSLNLPDLQICKVLEGSVKQERQSPTENTIEEGSGTEDEEIQSEYIEEDSDDQATSPSCNTAGKRRINNEYEYKKKKKIKNETEESEESTFLRLCDKFLSKDVALVVKAQARCKFREDRTSMDNE